MFRQVFIEREVVVGVREIVPRALRGNGTIAAQGAGLSRVAARTRQKAGRRTPTPRIARDNP